MTFRFLIHRNNNVLPKRKRCTPHFLGQFSISALFLFWFAPTPQEIQQTHLKNLFLYFIAFICVLETKDNICPFFSLRDLAEQVIVPHQYSSPVICLIKLCHAGYVFTCEIISHSFLLSSSSCSPGCHAILSAWPRKLRHCGF